MSFRVEPPTRRWSTMRMRMIKAAEAPPPPKNNNTEDIGDIEQQDDAKQAPPNNVAAVKQTYNLPVNGSFGVSAHVDRGVKGEYYDRY
jgi:hypothetical protein